jgi:hypothetical protein
VVDARSIEQFEREVTVQSRHEFADAGLALLIGALAGLAILIDTRLAFALVGGAAFALVLALVAALKRRSLIHRLTLERDAYVIPAVRRYGRRLTRQRARKRLSRSLTSLVADPWRSAPYVVPTRVVAFADDLEEIARELGEADTEVDPVCAAACLRLLTEGANSPLLNPALPVEDLRAALMRIRNGIHPHANRARCGP